MKFDVSRKANDDNPVQVDVVVGYDPELVEELDRLTAAEWFAQRDQRMRNNPGQTSFNAWRWELTPGVEVSTVDLPLRGVPAQGLMFADYTSRGKHTARFDPRQAQTVQFRDDAFRIISGKTNEPESAGWRPPVGWSLVGVGAVGLGLGMFFLVQANDTADEMSRLKNSQRDRYDSLQDDYDGYRTGSYIGFGVGAGLLVVGLTILLWPDNNESPFRDIPDSETNAAGQHGWGIPW